MIVIERQRFLVFGKIKFVPWIVIGQLILLIVKGRSFCAHVASVKALTQTMYRLKKGLPLFKQQNMELPYFTN